MSWKQIIWEKLKSYWITALYITIFFSIFTDYKRLILAHYQISYGEYGISLIKGLVLAKVIIVAEHLHLGSGFENKSLIIPTMYKSFLFTICVAVLSIIEYMIRGFLRKEGLGNIPDLFIRCFSYEWFASMLVVFASFIPFFGIRELSRVLGRGKISELFFHRKA